MNERDPDECIMRSIKINAPSFNGTLEPQLFLDWIKEMDHYFKWYSMSEEQKVSFAAMKLTGQASQYWANLEALRELREEHSIGTWLDMKTQLKQKYLPPYYSRLLDK